MALSMKKLWVGLVFMLGLLISGNASVPPRPDNKPLVIILMGPPGAGKGTHAAPLSQTLQVPHISTGDLFRENIRSQTALGKEAKTYIDKGNLVPDELVLSMLFERVTAPDCKAGYILDGFPRTIKQAEVLDERLKETNQVLVLNFNISDAIIIERVAGRIACKACGRPYHKKFDPPQNESICDSCGGPLYQREDDQEGIIRKRLDVYRAQTEPLIAYYGKQKGVLKEIYSQKEKAQVFQDVLESLPALEIAQKS